MPSFGKESLVKLEKAHPDLKKICQEAIKYFDFSVRDTHRTVEEQFALYTKGRAFVDGSWVLVNPSIMATRCDGKINVSTHNSLPSTAMDLYPYPYPEKSPLDESLEKNRFFYLAGIIMTVANKLYISKNIKHKLRWGGDFNSNLKFGDSSFIDCPHFELI